MSSPTMWRADACVLMLIIVAGACLSMGVYLHKINAEPIIIEKNNTVAIKEDCTEDLAIEKLSCIEKMEKQTDSCNERLENLMDQISLLRKNADPKEEASPEQCKKESMAPMICPKGSGTVHCTEDQYGHLTRDGCYCRARECS